MGGNTESTRQQKVAREIQRDMGDIFLRECKELVSGALVSVTMVRVSPDLSFAKIYISVFPFEKSREMADRLTENVKVLRKSLGIRVKQQLRIVPEIAFYIDDSMEYAANIDKLLQDN